MSDVPYITYAKEKYLPVFYFEGDTGPLQDAVIPVGDLEMAYLRLLYHVQGIREELINSPSAAKVVPLTSVLQSFPPSATVEEYWPERDFLPRSTMSGGVGGWTKLTCYSWLPPLTPVKEWPASGRNEYTLSPAKLLNFGVIDALNVKPNVTSQLLVTLPDLASCLSLDLKVVGQLLVKLKVTFYSPNTRQAGLLESKGKDMVMKPVPLVKVHSLLNSYISLLRILLFKINFSGGGCGEAQGRSGGGFTRETKVKFGRRCGLLKIYINLIVTLQVF